MNLIDPIDVLFKTQTSELLSRYEGTNTAVFFMGFGPRQTHILMELDQALNIPGVSWFDESGFLDLSSIESAAKKSILSICNTDGLIVGLYEHLARMKGSLPDLYEGDIVVVVNNMFEKNDLYPCAVSPSSIKALKDYLEQPDRSLPEEANLPSRYYADVAEVANQYLVAPIRYREEIGYEEIPFFEEEQDIVTSASSTFVTVSVPSSDFIRYRLDISNGEIRPACFLVEKNSLDNHSKMPDLPATLSVLNALNVQYDVVLEKLFTEDDAGGEQLLPYLHQYWGEDASYRSLLFYKNPDTSAELVEVSQGTIASHVIEQATIAMENEDSYQNIFITAPTGAGKSLLFQLPGIYLAEQKNAVTLVIEPTKSLMKDQVDALRKRGVGYATALNSDISYAERIDEIERIKDGSRSIVYLSPELLLSCNITDIIGDRVLGLVVVDEAHTVSLWGKDFRSDYWFLGDYLSKLRKYGMRFPIMCLTATAVYGGVDDVVFEVIEELELGMPKLFIGSVRRDDISFNINVLNKADYPGPIDTVKAELAADRLVEYVTANKHALVYCPFRSHVNRVLDFYTLKPGAESNKVMKYHAGLDAAYRGSAQRRFAGGECRAMVCTKAFGMGVDVDDITDVYHYAPTGNLADYIQEIGRGARRKDVTAVATIDFFPTDSRYYAQLYSMSALRMKQLREIMKKLYAVYMKSSPRKQNFLISPDSFTYLFGEGSDPVNKTKSALMMIAKDLETKYGYPVVIVKSKPTYTKNYVCIPDSIADAFAKRFGQYAKKVFGKSKKSLNFKNQPKKARPVSVSSVGDTYEIDMAKLWEDNFSDKTFGGFKHDFFSGEIIVGPDGMAPCMRQRLEIKYEDDFEAVCELFDKYMEAIEKVLFGFKMSSHEFTAREFKRKIAEELGDQHPFTDFTEQILSAFVKSPSAAMTRSAKSTIRVLTKKQNQNTPEPRYAVQDKAYINIAKKFARQLRQCKPWNDSNSFVAFLSMDKQTREEFDLAALLELFGLATYETRGGEEAEIFIRLNDPNKVQALANDPRYKNSELDRLTKRHENSRSIITNFFLSDIDDALRWDMIEAYFLGEDDYVAEVLGLETTDGKMQRVVTAKKAAKKPSSKNDDAVIKSEGTSMQNMAFSEIWKYVADDCTSEWEAGVFDAIAEATKSGEFEKPRYDVELETTSTSTVFTCSLAWPKKRVLLFLDEDVDSYERAMDSGWICFLISPEFNVKDFVDCIRE